MTTLEVAKVRSDLSDTINQVVYRGDRIVIRRRGKDVAVLIPVRDLKLLELIEDHLDVEAAYEALAEAGDDRAPWEQVKAELGL